MRVVAATLALLVSNAAAAQQCQMKDLGRAQAACPLTGH